jgi:hypothetical protein
MIFRSRADGLWTGSGFPLCWNGISLTYFFMVLRICYKIIMLEIGSSMLSEYLKCPTCNNEPNPKKLALIVTDGSSYNITHFNPNDPVIVSESEIYCSTDCYVTAVVKEEMAIK